MNPARTSAESRASGAVPENAGLSDGGAELRPGTPAQDETCDICGSGELEELHCRVICRNCRSVLRTCSDLY